MRVFLAMAATLALSAAAYGLDAAWQYDSPCAVRCLPAVIDCDGNGTPDVVFPTLYDGSVRCVDIHGALLRQQSVDAWIPGNIAVSENARLMAFEDFSGRITVRDPLGASGTAISMEGRPLIEGGLCVADIDGDGRSEIVTVRQNGMLGVFDAKLKPRWQYDAGASVEAPPAVAPVFKATACIYVCDAEGVVHAVSGRGQPLWRCETRKKESARVTATAPLVVQLDDGNPVVLFTQTPSTMIAVDAVDGVERWRVNLGEGNIGSPAIMSTATGREREILVATDRGGMFRIGGSGNILAKARLPEGRYYPEPLAADVDADGQSEILVATMSQGIVVASLYGTVKQKLALRGNAAGGLVLADTDKNGLLEILAATDSGCLRCFNTQAKAGWTHPRAGAALNGCVPPIMQRDLPTQRDSQRRIRIDSIAVNSYAEKASVGTIFLRIRNQKAGRSLSATVRNGNSILGSTFRPVTPRGIPIPFVQESSSGLTLDMSLYDENGRIIASSPGVSLRLGSARIVELTPLDAFFEELGERGDSYAVPKNWQLQQIFGKDFWHAARFAPEAWRGSSQDGAQSDLFSETIPIVGAEKIGDVRMPFGPKHKDWAAVSAMKSPFFVDNAADELTPRDTYDAILKMAGRRFLGFLSENGDEVIRKRLQNAQTRDELANALRKDFERLSAENYARLSLRQTDFLLHHAAIEAGILTPFAEIGGDTAAASLRFAFLRGAARQNAARSWAVSVDSSFRGASPVDAPDSIELKKESGSGTGPDCGHSASLTYRLCMASYFAGATYVQRDAEPRIELSAKGLRRTARFRDDVTNWREFTRAHAKRGVPYTPFAFMMDVHHTWKPGASGASASLGADENASIEAMLRHVFAMDADGDFEQGILTNGPYGDVFDIIVDDASVEVESAYGLVWLLGDAEITSEARERLTQYVRNGGILVLGANAAKAFPPQFAGVRFEPGTSIASQIQTGLAALPPIAAPYICQNMTPSRNTEVLAWTDAGMPLLTWRNSGEGMVIVAGTESWLDERGHLLPIAPGLLRAFSEAFLPVQQSPDVQMLLNRESDGWIVTLINNNGIRKVPTLAPSVDEGQATDFILRFKKGMPLQFLSYRGEFHWSNRANGLQTRLQPGEVAVVKATFGNQ